MATRFGALEHQNIKQRVLIPIPYNLSLQEPFMVPIPYLKLHMIQKPVPTHLYTPL